MLNNTTLKQFTAFDRAKERVAIAVAIAEDEQVFNGVSGRIFVVAVGEDYIKKEIVLSCTCCSRPFRNTSDYFTNTYQLPISIYIDMRRQYNITSFQPVSGYEILGKADSIFKPLVLPVYTAALLRYSTKAVTEEIEFLGWTEILSRTLAK